MKKLICLISILFIISTPAYSHRSGCHRWHSCPSDRGTYICGDLGYCSGCPDNEYCENGKPKSAASKQKPQQPPSATKQPENKTYHLCLRVIDGDTIVIEGNEKVRLIGVDTPETVHPKKPVQYFGKEASAFTKKMVEGKQVRLEYDWQRKDKYGRTLAYVYLEDGTFLNLEIIKQGYGFAYIKYPFKFLEEFRQAEKEARENKRGLWK